MMQRRLASEMVEEPRRRPAGKAIPGVFQRERLHHVGEGYLSGNYIRRLNQVAGGLRLSRAAVGYLQFIIHRLIRASTQTAARRAQIRHGSRIILEDVEMEPIREALPRDLPYDALKKQFVD